MYQAVKRIIDEQDWLDSVADPLQSTVTSLFSNAGESGKQVKNFLNGTWLGHPLHPLLTDVPVGAWTCTLALDTMASMFDDEGLQRAADVTLAVGLAGATGSAVTGWTDWTDTYGEERRVGLAHGLTMVATVLAYALSLIARLTGSRSAGILFSNTGYGLLSIGAYIGGSEVYDIGYGVNHTAFQHGPGKFFAVMPESELPADKPTKVDAQGVPVLLVKQMGQVYALGDTCVHAGCSLSGGRLEGDSIICPCHGSQFDLKDGAVINGPATMPEPNYEVRVQNGMIEVKQV